MMIITQWLRTEEEEDTIESEMEWLGGYIFAFPQSSTLSSLDEERGKR